MHVEKLAGRYALAAPMLALTPLQLQERDRSSTSNRYWLAFDRNEPVATASIVPRPDGRTLVRFTGNVKAVKTLAAALATEHARLVTSVDVDDVPLAAAVAAAGFVAGFRADRFEVRFEAALRRLRRVSLPSRYSTLAATDADPEELFALDNAIRNDVTGTDGWRGNRAWFDAELKDPAAYAVAEDTSTGRYVGLARIWDNPSGPRFGLVGVTRPLRGSLLGPALIRIVLDEASAWGFETFVTETAQTNRAVHPHLVRLGAAPLGGFVQWARP